MGTPIFTGSEIYWLEVVGRLSREAAFIGVLLAIVSLVSALVFVTDGELGWAKRCLSGAVVGVLLIISSIFIPSRETMVLMKIAPQLATYENAEWVKDDGKEVLSLLKRYLVKEEKK